MCVSFQLLELTATWFHPGIVCAVLQYWYQAAASADCEVATVLLMRSAATSSNRFMLKAYRLGIREVNGCRGYIVTINSANPATSLNERRMSLGWLTDHILPSRRRLDAHGSEPRISLIRSPIVAVALGPLWVVCQNLTIPTIGAHRRRRPGRPAVVPERPQTQLDRSDTTRDFVARYLGRTRVDPRRSQSRL